MIDTSLYDNFSKIYVDYRNKKSNYVRSVDRIIHDDLSGLGVRSLLDFGAGDGNRGFDIAHDLGIGTITLVEPSKKMIDLFHRNRRNAKIFVTDILGYHGDKHDVVLCLWNVLGHIESHDARVAVLRKIKESKNDGGYLYIDVNNRYNISAYGFGNVLKNMCLDLFCSKKTNGDVDISINVGDENVQGKGHVFTDTEMISLIKEAGMRVISKWYVDYKTGEKRSNQFMGQLMYKIV